MELGPHANFIIGAYTVAVLIVGALIAWVTLDHWHLARALNALEAQGFSRRSEGMEAR